MKRVVKATAHETTVAPEAAHQEFSPGLAGVPASKSSVSFVNGRTGLLEYEALLADKGIHANVDFYSEVHHGNQCPLPSCRGRHRSSTLYNRGTKLDRGPIPEPRKSRAAD